MINSNNDYLSLLRELVSCSREMGGLISSELINHQVPTILRTVGTMHLLDPLHLEVLLANLVYNTAHPLADTDSRLLINSFNGSERSLLS